MRSRWVSLGLVSLAGAAVACEARSSGGPADLVFRGGAIYTVDTAQPWVRAVAVRHGRIVYAGPGVDRKAPAGSTERSCPDGPSAPRLMAYATSAS